MTVTLSDKTFLLLVIICEIIWIQIQPGQTWLLSRRRRRRSQPKPPSHCSTQAWSQWSACQPFCGYFPTKTRTRSTNCKKETMTQNCRPQGGCEHSCNPTLNKCECYKGFTLDTTDGVSCSDIDECQSNQGRGPCSQKCENYNGNFRCSCEQGYRRDGETNCVLKDCNEPQFSQCPITTADVTTAGLSLCHKMKYDCKNGTKFGSQCTLSCPQYYKLAIKHQITLSSWYQYNLFDFKSPSNKIICHVMPSGTSVLWHTHLQKYYCRRVNDPPLSIRLDGTTLREHSPPGTIIGTLKTIDEQDEQTIVYSVNSPQDFFRCRGQTLETTVVFKWKPGVNNIYQVVIRAQDNGKPRMWKQTLFNITVENTNDLPRNIEISRNSILENATIGTILGTLTAIDDDVSDEKSSNFRWKLLGNSSESFSIKDTNVIVNKKLNYDSEREHHVRVACYDVTGAFSETALVIYVLNSIDPPLLTLNKRKIMENSNVGTIVGTIEAKSESVENLTFALSSSDVHMLSKFSLSSIVLCSKPRNMVKYNTTCMVNLTVSGHLDFEEQNEYTLQVFVYNNHSSNFKKWNITILNENEAPTALDINGMIEVPESTKSGEDLYFILVTDPDNRNGIIQHHSCRIMNTHRDGKYFQINAVNNGLQIKTNETLNYENQQSYDVVIACTDNGIPPLNITGSITINVTDTDEPLENLTLSSNEIPENVPNGTIIGYLDAHDPDIHRKKQLNFSIISPNFVPFRLTGDFNHVLIVNGSLNFELNSVFYVTFGVVDNNGGSLQLPFTINVLDVNEAPTDIQLSSERMNEELEEGSVFSNITMIDQDKNTVATCEIMNNTSGQVDVHKNLLVAGRMKTDYEKSTTKYLGVVLQCCDQHALCLKKHFHIEIKDVNEAPTDIVIDNLDVLENVYHIVIGRITVVDPDENQNHVCHFTNQNQSEYLKIINSSMTLYLMKRFNFEKQNVMNFEITCLEEGNVSTSSITKQFELNIIDENEAPVIAGCSVPLYIISSMSNGTILTSFNISDPDNERITKNDVCQLKQRLKYRLVTEDVEDIPFKLIDGYLVKTNNVPENRTYNLKIMAGDDGIIIDGISGTTKTSSSRKSTSNCTVSSADLQSSYLTLSSNKIHQLSTNGTIIGYFNTIKPKNPGDSDTISYQLMPSRCNNYPFTIVDNKLTLTLSEENIKLDEDLSNLPNYVIIQVKSNQSNDVIIGRFLIEIEDDADVKSWLCFQRQSVWKINANETKLVFITIHQGNKNDEESCSQKSQLESDNLICQSKSIYNGSSVDFQKLDLTGKIYIDKDMSLRINMSLDYDNYKLDRLVVHVTCWDPRTPLMTIHGKTTIHIHDCERTEENGRKICVTCKHEACKQGDTCKDLEPFGFQCEDKCEIREKERNASLCYEDIECPKGSLCSKMVNIQQRCVDQVFVLGVNFQIVNDNEDCQLEQCLQQIIRNGEEKCLSGKENKRKREKREVETTQRVEILKTVTSINKETSLIYIAVWKSTKGRYSLMNMSEISSFDNIENVVWIKTKDDCLFLKDSGIECPFEENGEHAGRKMRKAFGESKLFVAVAVGASLVFILILGAVVYCIKKRNQNMKNEKKSRTTKANEANENLGFYEMETTTVEKKVKKDQIRQDFNNPVYQEPRNLQEIDNDEYANNPEYSEPVLKQRKSNAEVKTVSNPLYGGLSQEGMLVETPSPSDQNQEEKIPPQFTRGGNIAIQGDLLNARDRCQQNDPKNKYPYYEELPVITKSRKTKEKKRLFGKSKKPKETKSEDEESPYYHVIEKQSEAAEKPMYFVLEKDDVPQEKLYQSLHRDIEAPTSEYQTYKLCDNTQDVLAAKERVYDEPSSL